MLTSIQADMVRFVHDSPEVCFDDLVKTFDTPDSINRIHYLVSSGILYRSLSRGDILTLTPKGLAALDEYDSALRKEAEQRAYEEHNQNRQNALENERRGKDAKRSWVQWTITTILSILSFFAGAVTEELTGFMQWVSSVFH